MALMSAILLALLRHLRIGGGLDQGFSESALLSSLDAASGPARVILPACPRGCLQGALPGQRGGGAARPGGGLGTARHDPARPRRDATGGEASERTPIIERFVPLATASGL
ncbi:hypothetical protein ACPA9J_35955, partial [Pseudomonas aeruginosa]